MIEDKLIERMKHRGLKFSDNDMLTLKQDLKKCLDENRFMFIERKDDNKTVGFLTWENIYRNNKRFVWVNNLFIDDKDYRNLLGLRVMLRYKIDRLGGQKPEFYYWCSQKDGRFHYAR